MPHCYLSGPGRYVIIGTGGRLPLSVLPDDTGKGRMPAVRVRRENAPLAPSGPGTGGKAHRGGPDAKMSGGPRGGDYIRAEVIWCLSQNRLNRF